MIYDGDYPWDVRVEKFLTALGEAGHETTLVARNKEGRPRREKLGDIDIFRLPNAGRFETLASFPAFFHPTWLQSVWRAARECRPERIIVRDLPLAPLGIWIGRRLSCPVLIDMAEPYPLALRSNWQFDRLGGLDHLIRNPRVADAVERWGVKQHPPIFVVSQEAGERLEGLGLSPERWTLVGNTPDVVLTRGRAGVPAVFPASLAGLKVLLFTGILVGDRGLDVALDGLARLNADERRVGLWVGGDGAARDAYEAHAARVGVSSEVCFAGWTPHSDLPGYWAAADIGILPFHTCPHIETTLANKLFDFMAVGLPIVGSDARPMKRVLAETGAGLTFRAGDPGDFAGAVSEVLDEPGAAKRMSECGLEASEEIYDWRFDADRLVEAVANPT